MNASTRRTGRSRCLSALLAVGLAMLAGPVPEAEATTASGFADFHYIGQSAQTFVVPSGVTSLGVVAVGGTGAPGTYGSSPGRGARVTGWVKVTPGQKLWIIVGGNGDTSYKYFDGGGAGGYNFDGCGMHGGAGGGATDVRTMGIGAVGTDQSRLVVAGGGGGGGGAAEFASGGGIVQGGAGGASGSAGATGGHTGVNTGGGGGAAGASPYSFGGSGGDASSCISGAGGGGGGGLKGGAGGLGGVGDLSYGSAAGGGGGGGTSLVPAGGSKTIDTTGVPMVRLSWDTVAPTATLTSPTATWELAPSTAVKWSAADSGGSGLGKFQLRYRRAPYNGVFGAWTYPAGWQVISGASRQVSAAMTPGFTYCYSVRAVDRAGNASAWSAPRCTRAPLDDRSLARSTGWTLTTPASAYKRTIVRATTRGSRLSRANSQVSRVALVAMKCPTCGTVVVKAGSTTIGSVNLYASTTRVKQVIALPRFSLRATTLTITVTSRGKPVHIDGLGVSRM